MANLIDASSAIYAWDNYPQDLFPDLWEWLAEQVTDQEIQSIDLITKEIEHKTPECGAWLQNRKLKIIPLGNKITQAASEIKSHLGITEDKYHPKGVGENDIFLIATAVVSENGLITNESIQLKRPQENEKYKIPLVCQTRNPEIPCYPFIEYLKKHWRAHQYDI